MEIEFSGKVWYWRGPSPYYFVRVPEQASQDLKAIAKFVTYGWGVLPVQARIGATEWKTSLIPKDGVYLVPLRDMVRSAEQLQVDDEVRVWLKV